MQFAGDAWNEELEGSYAEVRVLLHGLVGSFAGFYIVCILYCIIA